MPFLTEIERFVAQRSNLRPILLAFNWVYGSVYDIRHGVVTTKSSREPGQAVQYRGYEAMCGWHLRAGLPPGSVTPTDVFADIGSGKGRGVLLAASRYPFARVIGVEYTEKAHLQAQRNLEHWRGRSLCPVELVHADAVGWRVPPDVSVMFLFNPFVGPAFERFIKNLTTDLRRDPRPFRLIYLNATMHEVVVAAGFRFVRRRGRVSVYEWVTV